MKETRYRGETNRNRLWKRTDKICAQKKTNAPEIEEKGQESAITTTTKSTLFSWFFIIMVTREYWRRKRNELSDRNRRGNVSNQDGFI